MAVQGALIGRGEEPEACADELVVLECAAHIAAGLRQGPQRLDVDGEVSPCFVQMLWNSAATLAKSPTSESSRISTPALVAAAIAASEASSGEARKAAASVMLIPFLLPASRAL